MAAREAYHISWSQRVREDVAALVSQANAQDILSELAADLRTVADKLADDPLRWGDPLYNYHYLDLTLYRILLNLIQVEYAVDPVRRIVYIKDIIPLPGQALAP